MFERVFQWVMKRGAPILFALAFFYFAFAVLQLAFWILQLMFGKDAAVVPLYLSTAFLASLFNAGLLLVGTLVVNRLDRWLAANGRPD